jgi:hypothetical protein
MPFRERTTLPTQNPSVKIFFHGLNILRSPDGLSCIVETHRVPRHPHTLSVEVRTKTPNEPDLILMRHFGHFPGDHPGLSISVNPVAGSPATFKYVPIASFDPERTPTTPTEKKDFRWVINLEADHFHGHTLTVDHEGKTRPGILINSGVYYFYAAQLLMGPIGVVQGDTPKLNLAAMASIIGANLYLDDGSEAVITWRSGRDEFELPLAKPNVAAGVHYEIYIDNSPLFEPVSGPRHSELVEYYRVIPGIPPGQQHNLVLTTLRATLDGQQTEGADLRGSAKFDAFRGSARIPCQSITLDGTDS